MAQEPPCQWLREEREGKSKNKKGKSNFSFFRQTDCSRNKKSNLAM
jgi:hypothetical protein